MSRQDTGGQLPPSDHPGSVPSELLLRRNLEALAAGGRNRAAVQRIEAAPYDRSVQLLSSRSGLPVALVADAEREVWLHSRYDPLRESERAAAGAGFGGYVCVFGLGLGYHLEALLQSRRVEAVTVMVESASRTRSLLAMRDLSDTLGDTRLTVLAEPDASETNIAVRDSYLPAIHGAMETVVLQGARRLSPGWYAAAAESVRSAAEHALAEYHTQRRLGRRWYMNTLVNLAAGARGAATQSRSALRTLLHPERPAVITAAGPSLRRALPRLVKQPETRSLIATDSSLPVLLAAEITPDLVISIDCQQASYHHLLGSGSRDLPALLDLAGPPVMHRRFPTAAVVTSAHPLSRYVRARLGGPPEIDLAGGTVTYAAVALTLELELDEIELLGADFGYPSRVPYCVDSYLDHHFRTGATRIDPLEQRHLEFVFGEPGLEPDARVPELYRSPRMLRYQTATAGLARRYGRELVPLEPELGRWTIRAASGPPSRSPKPQHDRESGPAFSGSVRNLLRDYHASIAALRWSADESYAAYLAGLSYAQREVWNTLLPLLPAFYREDCTHWTQTAGQACRWALTRLNRILERNPSVSDDRIAADDIKAGIVPDELPGGGST